MLSPPLPTSGMIHSVRGAGVVNCEDIDRIKIEGNEIDCGQLKHDGITMGLTWPPHQENHIFTFQCFSVLFRAFL
jgi:hypothetical protein